MYSRTKSNALKGALLVLTALSVHCADVGEFCFTAGPSCGLTVDFDGGELDVGTYAITIETPAGVTSCDYIVAEPVHQDHTDAEEADEALAECAENGTCEVPCIGPETVVLRSSGLTISGDSEAVTVAIENVETGAQSEKSFSPSYADHPEECTDCVTATDSMPLPVAVGG